MQILNSQSAVLPNNEVLAHLNSLSARREEAKKRNLDAKLMKSPNYETIIKELTDYLSPQSTSSSSGGDSTDAAPSDNNNARPLPAYSAPHYTNDNTRLLLHKLEPYRLSKAELLMILNLRPTEMVLLDTIIEECDQRFSAEQQEAILGIVREVIGE